MALFLLSLSKFNSLCGGIVWEKVVHAKLSKGKILLNSEMNWRRQIRLCIKHITEDGKKHQTFEILKLNLVQFGGSPGNLCLEAALLGLGWSKLGVELLPQTESSSHLLLGTCQLALHILRLEFVRFCVLIFWAKNLQCGELLFQVFVFQEEFVELALVAVPATRVTVNIIRTFEVSSLIPVPGQVIADMHQGKRGETCPRGHSPFYQPTSYPAT